LYNHKNHTFWHFHFDYQYFWFGIKEKRNMKNGTNIINSKNGLRRRMIN